MPPSPQMTLERWAFLLCSTILVVVPTLFYIGYGIYFLVTDVDVCSDYSPLWVYGVVTFGLIVVSVPVRYCLKRLEFPKQAKEYFASISPDKLTLRPDWFIILPFWIAYIIYGGFVIYAYTCDDMKSHGLYVWALVTFYLNVAVAFVVVCVLFYGVICKKPKYEQLRNDEHDEERTSLRDVGF